MWFVGCEHAGKGLGWSPPPLGVPSSPGQRAPPVLVLHVQPATSSERPGHGQLLGKCVEYWIHRRMRKPRCHHRGVREEGGGGRVRIGEPRRTGRWPSMGSNRSPCRWKVSLPEWKGGTGLQRQMRVGTALRGGWARSRGETLSLGEAASKEAKSRALSPTFGPLHTRGRRSGTRDLGHHGKVKTRHVTSE